MECYFCWWIHLKPLFGIVFVEWNNVPTFSCVETLFMDYWAKHFSSIHMDTQLWWFVYSRYNLWWKVSMIIIIILLYLSCNTHTHIHGYFIIIKFSVLTCVCLCATTTFVLLILIEATIHYAKCCTQYVTSIVYGILNAEGLMSYICDIWPLCGSECVPSIMKHS